MYKKILALCLSVAFAMSAAMTPAFADNLNSAFGDDDKNILSALSKPDKKQNDKLQDILKHFTDSDDVDWAEKSIEKMGAMGILNGIGNGLFKPNSNVTHAEAIAMVLKLTGQKEEAEAIKVQPEYFKGISDIWSWGYLQLALNEGIIIPSEDGKFNPKTPAKRHEIAKYIVRALGKRDDALKNMNARLSFKDYKAIPSASIGYVYVINELGIMQGSKNEFQPNKPITRAEMAVLLDRAENSFDDSVTNGNDLEGIFVAYDKNTSQMTLNINNTQVVYKVNSYAPVYRNNTYYFLDTLKPGDIIEIVLDSNNTIIFVEFKEEGTAPTTGQQLSVQHIQYSSLPEELQDKIDTLKLTENYAAFKNEQYVYLVATKGRMRTGGYSIKIDKVYKETIQAGEFDLRAVVETENPLGSTTQDITYPYDIVRLAYFNGIEEIRFVNTENDLLEKTTLNELDEIELIEGTIDSVDTRNRIVYLEEADDRVRSYFIPTNVQIILDNRTVALSALEEDMTLTITRENGVITKLVAESTDDTVAVINGRITSVNTLSRVIEIIDNDGVERSYTIPRNAQIIVNSRTTTISSLEVGMTLAITKTEGIITKLVAEDASNAIEVITGKINSVDTTNRIVYLKESDNVVRPYFIPTSVQITLNNRTAALSALTENMTAAITKTNGVITKLVAEDAANATEIINGKINSIDAANRIVYLKETDNVVRPYFIPTSVRITLNNRTVALTDLAENMTVALTRTNGLITRLAATQTLQTINGKIDSVDEANNKVKLLEANNVVNTYTIPANAQITINNTAADLGDLTKGMSASITKVDGEITKLAAQNDTQLIEGILIGVTSSQNNSTINIKIGNTYKQYVITPETAVFYNNRSIAMQEMPLNLTITIKLINGLVTEVRNK